MREGQFVYYVIQHRIIAKSPWREPDAPLVPVTSFDDQDWRYSSWDVFGNAFEPWAGSGNDYAPLYRESYEDKSDLWQKTGANGWWQLRYAILGLRRAIDYDAAGRFDTEHEGRKRQAVRHEFRIVKIESSFKMTPVTMNEVVAHL